MRVGLSGQGAIDISKPGALLHLRCVEHTVGCVDKVESQDPCGVHSLANFLMTCHYGLGLCSKVDESDVLHGVSSQRNVSTSWSDMLLPARNHLGNLAVADDERVEDSRTIATVRTSSLEDFVGAEVVVHVHLVLQPNVGARDNFKSSLIVPSGERSNPEYHNTIKTDVAKLQMIPGLSPVSIAVTILWIARVRIVAHMVALTKDPEAVPTHRVGRVVVELIKWNLDKS